MKLSRLLKHGLQALCVNALLFNNPLAEALVTYTQGHVPIAQNQPIQFIVTFKPSISQGFASQFAAIEADTALPLVYVRTMTTGEHVLAIDKTLMNQQLAAADQNLEMAELAKKIAASSEVLDVTPDYILTMQATQPNVSEFAKQWDLYEENAGIDAPDAWDITTGSKQVVVGIIDTGIVNHENFIDDDQDKILPGYSFVRNSTDNHDDGVSVGDGRLVFHGTHVAGTIGASVGDGHHIAGIGWHTRLLPVQVLGSDGSGNMSNIIDGMRWAAGLTVANTPQNTHPAKVLNMSLGGQALLGCTLATTMKNAIKEITAKGITIVVAAGNGDRSGNPADVQGWLGFVPASCSGVITVASVGRNGHRAFYSNYGNRVDIAAPGGDQAKDHSAMENGIYSTTSAGNYEYYQGTSMAAPHVAGVVALMYAVNSELTPAQVLKGLTSSARRFPMDKDALSCSAKAICGAGILDAYAAVKFASIQ